MAKRKRVEVRKPMTRTQLDDFFNSFNTKCITGQRNQLFFKTLLNLGARCSEILNMRYEDIHIDDDGDYYYHLITSKSGRGDFLPMPTHIYEAIMELSKAYGSRRHGYVFRPVSKDKPLEDRYMRKVSNEYGERANIPFTVKTHDFRRTFAYHLFKKNGGNIYEVSRMLRHSDIGVTTVYLAMFTDDKKRAVKDLF